MPTTRVVCARCGKDKAQHSIHVFKPAQASSADITICEHCYLEWSRRYLEIFTKGYHTHDQDALFYRTFADFVAQHQLGWE